MRKSLLALGVAISFVAPSTLAAPGIVHPFHAAQAKDAPNEVHMAVGQHHQI